MIKGVDNVYEYKLFNGLSEPIWQNEWTDDLDRGIQTLLFQPFKPMCIGIYSIETDGAGRSRISVLFVEPRIKMQGGWQVLFFWGKCAALLH